MALISTAEAYGLTGHPERAEALMGEAVAAARESPKTTHLMLRAGEACVRAALYEKAVEIAERMEYLPHATQVLAETARAQFREGQREAGLASLQKLENKILAIANPEAAGLAWVKLAAVAAEAGLTERMEGALREAMSSAGRVDEPLPRGALRDRVARTYVEAGRLQDALEVTLGTRADAFRFPALANLAEAYAEAGLSKDMLPLLDEEWHAAGDPRDLGGSVRSLLHLADAYRLLGRPARARAVLGRAEQVARRIRHPHQASVVADSLASAYVEADDADAAGRLVRDLADESFRRTALVRLAALYGEKGRYEEAVRAAQDAGPKPLRLAGNVKLRKIAEAYYQVWGLEVERKKAERLQPSELGDAVLARYAKAWAEQGAYEKATQFARVIDFKVSADNALSMVANRCLEGADSIGAAAPAFEILELLAGRLDQFRLRAGIAGRQAELGLREEALATLAALEEEVAREEVYSAGAEILCEMAMTYHALGRGEHAKEVAARSIAAALKVACASCRDDVLEQIFKHLSGGEYVELAFTAARKMDLPRQRAENFVRMYDLSQDLSPDEAERLLRGALASSLEVSLAYDRIRLLVWLAPYFHNAHLQITPAEWNELRESYRALQLAASERAKQEAAQPRPKRPRPIHLVYFDRPGCPLCEEVKSSLEELRGMFHNLRIRTHDLSTSESAMLLNVAICEGLSMPQEQRLVAPSIFSAEAGLVGSEISLPALAELARASEGLESPAVAFGSRRAEARSQLADAYERLGLLVVISAGLADGINPCAFTVIIFFLAYLAHIGKSRREIAVVGSIFTAAVFLAYFTFGLGLAGLVSAAEEWSGTVTRAIYGLTAALAMLAAVLSFRDGLRCLAGRTAELTLSLPDSLQRRIRLAISRRARLGLTVAATAVLGGAVALFELPCTGQMYLPVIVFGLHHLPGRLLGPVGWLLLYNLCFIAPLIVVFVAVFFGLTSERLTSIFRRHIAVTKFAMAAVFATLCAFMLTYLEPVGRVIVLDAVVLLALGWLLLPGPGRRSRPEPS
ncbi:MAG: hypothetical protein ACYS1C_06030 [Planctomycetota bacterium]